MHATIFRSSKTAIGLSISLSLMMTISTYAQEKTIPLEVRLGKQNVAETDFNGANFIEVLMRFASKNEVPIGVEWIADFQSLKPAQIHAAGNVIEGLASIMRQYPEYRLDVEKSIVHVYPRTFQRRHNFLSIVIPHFEIHEMLTSYALVRLQQQVQLIVNPPMPSFSKLRPAPVPQGGVAGHVTSSLGDKKISVSLDAATVEDVLDEFVKLSGFKIWVVTYTDPPSYAFGGYRKSVSVFSSSPNVPPDIAEPQWNLLLWGVDPASGGVREDWHRLPNKSPVRE